MLERIRKWWGRLAPLQRNALAIGVPVVGAAAVWNRRRGPAPAADGDAAREAAGAVGFSTVATGGPVSDAGSGIDGFVNAFSDEIAAIEASQAAGFESFQTLFDAQAAASGERDSLLDRLRDQLDRLTSAATDPPASTPTPAPGPRIDPPPSAPPASDPPASTAPAPGAGGSAGPGSGGSSGYLRRGSRGQAVSNLQRWLADNGYNPGPIDGIFGPKTDAAVRRFQRAAGIQVDGIVGPQTRGAMNTSGSGGGKAATGTGSGGKVAGMGGGRPIRAAAGIDAMTVPAIRPAAAAGRIGGRRDRQRIAALASVRALFEPEA